MEDINSIMSGLKISHKSQPNQIDVGLGRQDSAIVFEKNIKKPYNIGGAKYE